MLGDEDNHDDTTDYESDSLADFSGSERLVRLKRWV